jgi:predicted RNA-binding protein with PUA-like domain
MWDGVRNYAARNNLRSMRKGDLVLFYQSITGKEVVGICEVDREHYPDPTADKGDWSVVDLVPRKRLVRPVPLATIKSDAALQQIALVRMGRLSVMPLEKDEFYHILSLGDTAL